MNAHIKEEIIGEGKPKSTEYNQKDKISEWQDAAEAAGIIVPV